MKLKKPVILFLLAASSSVISSSFAATAIKSGTGSNLSDTASGVWTGGSGANGEPTSADIATFSSDSLTGPLTADTPVTWKQLWFGHNGTANSDITAPISITGSKITLLNTGDNGPSTNTLRTASTKAVTIGNDIDFTNGAGLRASIRVEGTGALTLNGAVNFTSDVLLVRAGGAGLTTINGNISGNGRLQVTEGSHLVLAGTNTYPGATTISNGSITINSIKNVNGGASALGAVTTIANGTIGLGENANAPALKYMGAGDTTDRVLNLTGTTGTVTLEQSGTGLLKFTSPLTATGAGNKTLVLQGSTEGAGEIGGAIVNNSPTNKTSLTKSGSGTWTLSGANTYTGNTTINGGTLALAGSAALASPTITVASGALFNVSGLTSGDFAVASGQTLVAGRAGTPAIDVAGSLTFNGGSVLNIAGSGAVGTATIDGNLTLNGAQLPIGYSGLVTDKVSLAGASRTLTLTGITAVSGFMPPGTYTLIDGYSSVSGSAANLSYPGGARGATGIFTVGASSVTLDVTAGSPMALTWSGTPAGAVWDVNTTANWNTGTEKFFQLDAVTFADNTANSTVTINGNVQPGSITFTNSSTSYTVRGGTSPVIAGTGALAKTGTGAVNLWHPANTYSGGTTVSAGTLSLNNGGTVNTGSYSPLGTGLVTLNGGGTLLVNPANGGGNTFTFPNAITLNGGTLYHQDGNSVFNGVVTVDAASSIKTEYGGKNITLAGGLAGSANLTVSDQGGFYESANVILGADGTYSGNLTISNAAGANGGVQLNTANALQNATVTVNTTAAMDGSYPRGLVLGGAAATNFTIAGLGGNQATAAIHNANDANTRTLTVNQSGNTTFAGTLGGTSANTQRLNLVKSGSGSLTLAGANTYTGNTTVNGGTLVMSTRNIGSGTADVIVADDATLGLNSTGVPLLIDELNLGTSGANTIAITNFTPNETTPVIDANVLAKNATTTISVGGTLVSGSSFPQVYPLIGYVSATGIGTFTLAPLPRGVTGELEDDGDSINLKVTGFDNLVWKGTAGDTWDLDTTSNWKLGALNPATYQNGDNVVFDGSATNTTVDLTTTASPTSLTFDFDDPVAYTLGGTGTITGATGLFKKGTGTLALNTANSYDGITSVNAGSLVLGNASALGSTLGSTTVADGAILDLNGYSTASEAYLLDGSLLNNGGAASTVGGAITLNGDAEIGGSGDIALTAPVSGSYSLMKTGADTLTFGSALNSSITGTLTVNAGMVILAGSDYNSALGNSAGIIVESAAILRINATNKLYTGSTGIPVTVNAGGKVELNAYHNHFKILNLNGGEISGIGSGMYDDEYSTFDSPITVAGTAMSTISRTGTGVYLLNGGTFDVADATTGTDLLISAPLTGGVLTKSGDGTMELSAANTYTGNTTVSAGTLHVSAAGRLKFVLGNASGTSNSLGGAGSATLDGGFTIDTSAADSLTSGTWNLETMGATSTYNNGFVVFQADGTTPWIDAGGNTWTKPGAGGKTWTFDEATGTLTLVTLGYDAWAAQIPNIADRIRSADVDGDGLTNLQEFLFGKNPLVSDGTLTNCTVSGGNLTLVWLERETGSTYTLKESSSLDSGSWTTSAITPVADLQGGDPANYDQWKAVIPLGSGKKFFRIEGVENTP